MAIQREKLVRTAEKLVSKGRVEAAIKEYRKLLKESPKDTNTLNRVGDLYARINKIEEAAKLFTQIAEQYTEEGFFVKAIAIYKKIIKLDPTRLEVYERLAELYHKQGLVNEARTQYQVLADYYLKHDNAASAISIYQRMVELEPEDPAHHAKLAELYNQQQLVDKAMDQYRIIAEIMIGHGHLDQAAQVLERALDVSVEDLDFIGEAVAKLRQAGDTAGAARLLAKATELNPDAERFAFEEPAPEPVTEVEAVPQPRDDSTVAFPPEVLAAATTFEAEEPIEIGEDTGEQMGLGGGDGGMFSVDPDLQAAMAAAEAAVGEEAELEALSGDGQELVFEWDDADSAALVAPPSDMDPGAIGTGFLRDDEEGSTEAPPTPPDFDSSSSDSFELDLEALETLDEAALQIEAPALAEEEIPQPQVAEAAEVEPELAVAEEEEEELELAAVPADDFLSEAEVLAKYGLKEKAEERVREVLETDPDHFGAHRLLIQLHLEGDNGVDLQSLALRARELAEAQGLAEEWRVLDQQLQEVGLRVDPEQPSSAPVLPKAPKPKKDRINRLLDALLEDTPSTRPSKRAVRAVEHLFDEAPGSAAPPPEVSEVPVEEPAPMADPPSLDLSEFLPPGAEEPPTQELDVPIVALEESSAEVSEELPEALPAEEPELPDLSGVDLHDDTDIEDALASLQPVGAAAPAQDLDDTGMSWLDEVEAQPQDAEADELFSDEDDFFDLAAELEQELSATEEPIEEEREQTLEEIVEGFKQGVAENLSPEDYDTHFNLGIAYREMGLLDEAIGEFQLAAKDDRYLVHCCSMLGICFLEKGLPDLAVKWYTRGLAFPELAEDDSLALLYDLGAVYLSTGDEDNARKTFSEVYGLNSNFRDVATKLADLG